jgi:2-polyprenyl-3-methyl-5-hydroxy-6-metoxy-1,4-benzoquinol methylase
VSDPRTDEVSADRSTLAWTGERYVPEIGGQIALEHVHRYALASELAGGLDVLDIACGEGYGSAMLAARARHVVGVDLAVDVVTHARRRYGRSAVQFLAGRADQIPLAAASVDLVVCFETIEHMDGHELVVAELKRVLRSGGVLIISSPEKSVYANGTANPYHVKELHAEELRSLLASRFRNVAIAGQRVLFGSVILAEAPGPMRTYERAGDTASSQAGLVRPEYVVAVATDGDLPELTGGVLEQPINETDIVLGWSRAVAERDGRITELLAEAERSAAELAGEKQAAETAAAQFAEERSALSHEIADRDATLAQQTRLLQVMTERADAADRHLELVHRSWSWRLTRPLRALKRLLASY